MWKQAVLTPADAPEGSLWWGNPQACPVTTCSPPALGSPLPAEPATPWGTWEAQPWEEQPDRLLLACESLLVIVP